MKYRYVMNLFTFYDRSGIENYLEEQAKKGLIFEKAGSVFWQFSKTEPADLRFAVTYFPSASAYDPSPSENQLRFREFCEHTGWRHIADCAQMQIYCNDTENPIPIETDALIECENIHRSAKKSYLSGYIAVLVIGIMILLMQIFNFSRSPVEHLSSPVSLSMVLLGLNEAAMGGGELLMYFKWYRKAKKAAEENGAFTETSDWRIGRTLLCLLALIILTVMFASLIDGKAGYSFRVGRVLAILIASLALVFGAAFTASSVMKKMKISAKTNRIITVLIAVVLSQLTIAGNTSFILKDILHGNFIRSTAETYEYNGNTFYLYHDELPLYIENLTDTDYDGYSTKTEVRSSPLVSLTEAYQRPRPDAKEHPTLEYIIVDVKLPILFDICLRDMLNISGAELYREYGEAFIADYTEIDASEWNADRAYQLKHFASGMYSHDYILVYENRIVRFKPDFHPDSAQKIRVSEILGK